MKQIANLLSGFQKQFPPTNNQLRSSSNKRTHATVHDRQITTESVQRRFPGHVARQCKEPKHPKYSLWHQDKVMLLQAKENGAVLYAEAEAFLANVECNVPLAKPLTLTTTNMFQVNHEDAYDSDMDDEPNAAAAFMANLLSSSSQINEASPIPSTVAYMLQTLTDLTTQVEGHRKVNQEQSLVNATLFAKLDQCKLELARLKRNKVKLECDQVIVARNKRNVKLEQETELLKTTRRNKEATIASLTSETKTVLSEKKTLDKYLEEIVCLKNANQVATGLCLSNPWFGRKAQFSQPTLYDGHRLLQHGHAPVMVSDSHETLLEIEVIRMKMSQKLGHVTPVDYTKLNALYDQFVPQKELSREQVYWLSASDIASQSSDPPKPMTPFVHTHLVNSE
nr:hypothetical protein [Tanacetum cinerariifolium]